MAEKYAHEKMLLFQAATSQYGIVIATTEMERDLGALYAALRAERSGLPPMSLMRSPWSPRDEIWIVKKTAVEAGALPAKGIEELPPPAITDISLGDLGL